MAPLVSDQLCKSISLVNTDFDAILQHAMHMHASDLHLEPLAQQYRIRYRIHGDLHSIHAINLAVAKQIINKIKIAALLDITEQRLPQDGKFLQPYLALECRVSITPTVYGEKLVLRLIPQQQDSLTLAAIGFTSAQYAAITDVLDRQSGFIILAGPTGSGKTQTAYSILSAVDHIAYNVISIENPVEKYLAGINQYEINDAIGLTAPVLLKAILRQDPDIIFIGEIRDLATAKLACYTAHTGHLVLATVHAYNVSDTIQRLQHLDITPAELEHTHCIIIAQRLVKILCNNCKIPSYDQTLPDIPVVYSPNPHHCQQCSYGYTTRQAVFELYEQRTQNIHSAFAHVMYELLCQGKITLTEYKKYATI